MNKMLLGIIGIIFFAHADVIKEARRLAVNDSVAYAIQLLTDSLKKEHTLKRRFELWLEQGDLLFQYAKGYKDAAEVYASMIEFYKGKREFLKNLYYRAGIAYELAEDFKKAAEFYEKQVIEFPNSPFKDDALSAIERCFKKNYEEVVAKVDGYPITRLELDEYIESMPPFKKKKYQSYEKKKELLEKMIFDRLMYLEAMKRMALKDSVSVECFKGKIVNIKIPFVCQKNDLIERLEKAEDNILFRKLYEYEITSKVSVTEKEIKNYYKTHREEFKIPKRYTYREILVKDSLKLDTVLTMLDSLPFDSVAKIYSEAYTRNNGGLVSKRWETNIPEKVRKIIASLKVGSISKPIHTSNGYLIIKLEKVYKPTYRRFEEVKEHIKHKLQYEKTEKRYNEVVERYKRSVPIDTTFRKDTIGIVNGYVITQKDFEKKLLEYPDYARESYKKDPGRHKLIENLIFTRILKFQVANTKVYMNDSIQQRLYRRKKEILINFLRDEEINKKLQVSDEEVEDYYKKHRKEFYVPAKVKLREMFFTSKDTAEKVYQLLKQGLPFDSLAREYSEAVSSKKGGYVGYITMKDKDKYPYVKQAFKLKEGEFSKPIKLGDGYYILFVETKKKGYQRTLEQAKSEIEFKLKREKRKALEAQLKGRLFSSAHVEIYLKPEKDTLTK